MPVNEKLNEHDLKIELYQCALDEFEKLTEQKQKYLLSFIHASYRIRATINDRCNSYILKREFENWPLGFYITNDQFKGAMLKSGYKAFNLDSVNWRFNIKKQNRQNHV
jgi:hypothetical protein